MEIIEIIAKPFIKKSNFGILPFSKSFSRKTLEIKPPKKNLELFLYKN